VCVSLPARRASVSIDRLCRVVVLTVHVCVCVCVCVCVVLCCVDQIGLFERVEGARSSAADLSDGVALAEILSQM
jgi:hypothetical protein